MFNLFNDSGVLVMDANDSQLALAGPFIINLTSTTTVYNCGVSFDSFIGLGNTNGAYVRVVHDKSTGNITVSSDRTGVSVTVYLFVNLKNITQTGNPGLNIFDAEGKLLFDATIKVGRVSSKNSSQLTPSQSIPNNAVPVLCFPELFKIMQAVPQGTGMFIFYFGLPYYSNNNTTLLMKHVTVGSAPLPVANYPTQPDYATMNVPILFLKI